MVKESKVVFSKNRALFETCTCGKQRKGTDMLCKYLCIKMIKNNKTGVMIIYTIIRNYLLINSNKFEHSVVQWHSIMKCLYMTSVLKSAQVMHVYTIANWVKIGPGSGWLCKFMPLIYVGSLSVGSFYTNFTKCDNVDHNCHYVNYWHVYISSVYLFVDC